MDLWGGSRDRTGIRDIGERQDTPSGNPVALVADPPRPTCPQPSVGGASPVGVHEEAHNDVPNVSGPDGNSSPHPLQPCSLERGHVLLKPEIKGPSMVRLAGGGIRSHDAKASASLRPFSHA